MILKDERERYPQISFPSWIIKSYNPTNKLQTADLAVLQSLDETYRLKEKETEKSVINYLDDIIDEFVAEENDKEKKNELGKLQCEVVSKGQHFEIHLDSSSKTNKPVNTSVQHKTKEVPLTKVVIDKTSNIPHSNVAFRKELDVKEKPKSSSHLITVECSQRELAVEKKEPLLNPTKAISNVGGRKRMKNNQVTIEVVKTNGNDLNEKGALKNKKVYDSSQPLKTGHPKQPNSCEKKKPLKSSQSNSSQSSINEVKEVLDTIISLSDTEQGDAQFGNATQTPFSNAKLGLKPRPKSADFSLQLHRISNKSGNKTELRRSYTEPMEEIREESTTVPPIDIPSPNQNNSENTPPSGLKKKLNSFRTNDLISSLRNRLFKYPKENIEKRSNTLEFPPRKVSSVSITRSMRGFDSFMLY